MGPSRNSSGGSPLTYALGVQSVEPALARNDREAEEEDCRKAVLETEELEKQTDGRAQICVSEKARDARKFESRT